MLYDANKENHKLRTHFLILRLLIYECFRIQYSKYQIKKDTDILKHYRLWKYQKLLLLDPNLIKRINNHANFKWLN